MLYLLSYGRVLTGNALTGLAKKRTILPQSAAAPCTGFQSEQMGMPVRDLRVQIIPVVLSLIFAGGCAASIEITHMSPGSDGFTPLDPKSDRIKPVAYLKTIKVIQREVEYPPSDSFLFRIRNKLLETGLFSDVRLVKDMGVPRAEFNVVYAEGGSDHAFAGFIKSVLVAASLFILSPVLPIEEDFWCTLDVKVVRWDGQDKHYQARSEATMRARVPELQRARSDLHSKPTTYVLNSWMSQMLLDPQFYEVPLQDREKNIDQGNT